MVSNACWITRYLQHVAMDIVMPFSLYGCSSMFKLWLTSLFQSCGIFMSKCLFIYCQLWTMTPEESMHLCLPWLHSAKQAGKSQLLRRYLHMRMNTGQRHGPQKWLSFMASNGLLMITRPISCYTTSMTQAFVSCPFTYIQHISIHFVIWVPKKINVWQVMHNMI